MNIAAGDPFDALGSATALPLEAAPSRIAIVTDAWFPQTNGVVRTLVATKAELERRGHTVGVFSPEGRRSIPCPTYPEIRLALTWPGALGRELSRFAPDAVHIVTEGPLGLAARRFCLNSGLPFTTAYHTQFPQYVAHRTGLPAEWLWRYISWFHRPAQRLMVATESISKELREHGLQQLHRWSRGVALDQFTPEAAPPQQYAELDGPILLYVGRVAVEKNIEAFLDCDYPGAKVVVGDGPARPELERRYPEALFLGKKTGAELAGCYAGADVFVFPSRTDTFGLVMIEAMACGLPVAAFPVAGPVDIVTEETGALSDDLARAIDAARYCSPFDCIAHAASFTWEAATDQFLDGLVPAP